MNASIFFSCPEISIINWSGLTSRIRPRKICTRALISGRSAGGALDLDQHQVALDVILARDVVDLHDRHDLLELLSHLIEVPVVAHHDDRDPRELRVLGLADRQALDVEAARRKHPRDVRQHARLVLHQRREQVTPAPRIGTFRRPGVLADSQLAIAIGTWPLSVAFAVAVVDRSRRVLTSHGRASYDAARHR